MENHNRLQGTQIKIIHYTFELHVGDNLLYKHGKIPINSPPKDATS